MKRIAVIDRKKCNIKDCDRPCIRFCPRVRTGDETVSVKSGKIIIDEGLCIGCGICVKKCPRDAIRIVNLAAEPAYMIHQYGENAFRLYGLPMPLKGKVTGLLGANGIGKTTALQILSGAITPNLGELEKALDTGKIVKMFRGTELQNYLVSLFGRKLKTVYKPQQVDAIPKHFNGTPDKLMKDERGVKKEVVKKLGLEGVVKRDISKLSGGELQRVAIAAVIVKDADVYYFDEPSSFLDVKQRLITARAIRELADQGKAVIVVEHDLATLDYLADNIHLVYGEPGVYGVISALYAARRGINMYLEGYIREENVRFREESLDFRGAGQLFKGTEKVIEYPLMEKKLDSFSLSVNKGCVYAGEILGVFGANALGKTTLARILAGELKADKGKPGIEVKIAYKPQYLSSDFKGTVAQLLSTVTKRVGTASYRREIIKPLELESLMDNTVANLSGGELQRAAIALALSQKADFILLDEPSAYLDVEQRVKFARMIRRFVESKKISCMTIDHDLLVLDYVSDRSMLFQGTGGKEGRAGTPGMHADVMNLFLKGLGTTFRKDPETGRPRANKPGSQKDLEQKKKGKYYGG